MAELFSVDVRTVNEHLQNIFTSGEMSEEGTIREIRIVQMEGKRKVEHNHTLLLFKETLFLT